MEEPINKIWETFGTFNTFEEADIKRKTLESTHEAVKVKRCGRGGSSYKIKFWNTPLPQGQKKKKSKKKREQK